MNKHLSDPVTPATVGPAGQVPTIVDVRAATQRLKGKVRATPLLEWPMLNEQVGGRVLIKPECLQHTGSFKIRGATNFIGQLTEAQRQRGVVAYSSGNHAAGVAAAARLHGIPATIVMPSDAPRIKLDNTKRLGANIVLYNRHTENREAMAADIATETGATIVPPYDHPWTIAGQGTVAMEIVEQTAALGAEMDALLVPCGGGGLTAGCALTIKDLAPRTAVHFVEPQYYDETGRSFDAGERLTISADAPPSACDALMAPTPGELTFAINQRLTAGGLSVNEDDIRVAMATAFTTLKLVVEPGGAVALAAVISGVFDCHDKTVVVILSGGNVDSHTHAKAVRHGLRS